MTSPSHPLLPRYVSALLAGDRQEAVRLVLEEGVQRGETARAMSLDVVASAQREIGRLWEENRISVADEHQATAISQVVLAHLYSALERETRLGKKVLVACVEGELHDMAARVASDLLDSFGFDIVFLGANCPTSALEPKIRSAGIDAAALSVTMIHHIEAARHAVHTLREALGPEFPIVIGGEAASAIPAEGFDGAVVSRGSALELVETLRSALGLRSAA